MERAFASRGVRALVILHEQYLREFLGVWREFRASGRALPETTDPSYASPEKLLHHVLRAARGYLTWICEKLDAPDPEVRIPPTEETIETDSSEYLEHVLDRWRNSLLGLTDESLEPVTYESRWGVPYSIDAMLEHAVIHPIRHSFQLRERMSD